MNGKLNIDILGGLSVLAIAAFFFFFQLGDDFSMFALFFPERMLPALVLLGLAVIVKGFVRPTKLEKPVFRINGTMIAAVVTGLLWVILLEPVGFIITSFFSVSGLQILYMPRDQRCLKSVFVNLAGSLIIVLLFYYVFVQFLGVTLPAGVFGI